MSRLITSCFHLTKTTPYRASSHRPANSGCIITLEDFYKSNCWKSIYPRRVCLHCGLEALLSDAWDLSA